MTNRALFPSTVATVLALATACADIPTDAVDALDQPEPQRSLSSAGHETVFGLHNSTSDLFAVGMTSGSLDGPSRGGFDAFVRQYRFDGELVWAAQFGSTAEDRAYDVSVGQAGYQIAVAGATRGSIGGSRGQWDAFVRVYMPGGTVQWTKQFGTTLNDEAKAVAADATGNIYVVGLTAGTLGPTRQGDTDAFIRKFNSSGEVVWTRQFGTRRYDAVTDIDLDEDGNLYIVGNSTGNFVQRNRGLADVFVQMLTPDGDPVWTRTFGSASLDEATGIAVNATHVAVVGATTGALYGVNAGGHDAFIRVYQRDGTPRWTRQLGSTEIDRAEGVDAYPDLFVLAGTTEGDLTAGVTTPPDGFVALYGLDARRLSLFTIDTGEMDQVFAVAAGQGITVAGDTEGDFVEGSLGGFDGFIWHQDGSEFWFDQ